MQTVNVAWAPASLPRSDAEYLTGYVDALRRANIAAYAVLRETDSRRQRDTIVGHLREFLDASVVRGYDVKAHDGTSIACGDGGAELPAIALEMERELLRRALEQEQSLISSHPRLDPELSHLAQRCRREQIITHVMLARSHGQTHGVFAVHWLGRSLPPYERREGVYSYFETAALALASTRERARVERELAAMSACLLTDPLTGLPNGTALNQHLREHAHTTPLSVVAVDFDGMKEANNAFKTYELGGDVLIRAVGAALPAITSGIEFAARLHRAGDEFAVVLPHADESTAIRRAEEIEAALDALDVPPSHQSVYRGASVAAATRSSDETPEQVLERAVVAMHIRKHQRRIARRCG